ncbi:MAG: acyl-CoA thioesterase [Planctomycetota bacterium]
MTDRPGSLEDRTLALRFVTMPKDTNHYGTIFGGVILSAIDQAGFVHAQTHARCRWVTAAVDRVDFRAPVQVGDTVECYATTARLGTTSVTLAVDVEVERCHDGCRETVTRAELTMVAVDEQGMPRPFRSE